MEVAKWFIPLILLYFPIYIFNNSLILLPKKMALKKMNKIELILLLPFGLIYHYAATFLAYNLSAWLGHTQWQDLSEKALFFLDSTIGIKSPKFHITSDALLPMLLYYFIITIIIPYYLGYCLRNREISDSLTKEFFRSFKRFRKTMEIIQKRIKKDSSSPLPYHPWKIWLKISIIAYYSFFLESFLSFINIGRWIADLLKAIKSTDKYLKFISIDLTPEFVRDSFPSTTHCCVLDIVIDNGKMFTGVLSNYDVDEAGRVRGLSLVYCL